MGDGASLEVTSGTSTARESSVCWLITSPHKRDNSQWGLTCFSTVENNLLRLVGGPELVEPVPPEPAGSIRQEAAEAEPDGGPERCVPADCAGGTLQHLAVVCRQVVLEVRLGQLGQLVMLAVSTECREGHV